MIAGGSEACITPVGLSSFCAARSLSKNSDPKTACRPFDNDRDGFVMGEGAGVLILESLDHAKARGATIYAELAGYSANGDSYHITAPSPDGEGATRAIVSALNDAKLNPEDVDYVNAHGTSTELNDKGETMAIKAAFGDHATKLSISSTKSMTAHPLGAAGAIEAIASIAAINQGFIPPTINYHTPDPECDLDYTPNQAKDQAVEVAISNSFGFGGHNSVLVFKQFS